MGYVAKNLLADEEIIVEAEHSKIAFAFPLALAAVGIYLMSGDSSLFGGAFLLTAVYKAGKISTAFLTEELALTDERAVGKTGLISRDSLEMRNEFLSGVAVSQSIPGRVLNYGEIEVRGEGVDSADFEYVKKPEELRNTVQEYLANVTDESQ